MDTTKYHFSSIDVSLIIYISENKNVVCTQFNNLNATYNRNDRDKND